MSEGLHPGGGQTGMFKRLIVCGAIVASMCGCGALLSEPAALRLSDGRILTGSLERSVGHGTLHVATADMSLYCSGTYTRVPFSSRMDASLKCSDSNTGTLPIDLDPSFTDGSGTISFANGDTGDASFGALARNVSSTDTTAMGSAGSLGSGCVSTNAYGATSCVNGLPKTHFVSDYYRSNGTHVSEYWRSR